jgi:ABC-type bacteriocin/lantibiotic exporter with double-glycine peptidase domain
MHGYREVRKTAVLALAIVLIGCVGREATVPQCGVASLLALLANSGHRLTYDQVAREVRTEGNATSFYDLREAAHRLGLELKAHRVSLGAFRRARMTGILYVPPAHFVAVCGHRGDSVLIVDAAHQGEIDPKPWDYTQLRERVPGDLYLLVPTTQLSSQAQR